MFRVGEIVKCIERPDWLHGFSEGHEYVVNAVKTEYAQQYIKILGDDDRAHVLLARMFKRKE